MVFQGSINARNYSDSSGRNLTLADADLVAESLHRKGLTFTSGPVESSRRVVSINWNMVMGFGMVLIALVACFATYHVIYGSIGLVKAPFQTGASAVSTVYEDATSFVSKLLNLKSKEAVLHPGDTLGRINLHSRAIMELQEYLKMSDELNRSIFLSQAKYHNQQAALVKELADLRAYTKEAYLAEFNQTSYYHRFVDMGVNWGFKTIYVGISAGAGLGTFQLFYGVYQSELFRKQIEALWLGVTGIAINNAVWLSWLTPILSSAYIVYRIGYFVYSTKNMYEAAEKAKKVQEQASESANAWETFRETMLKSFMENSSSK